MSDTDFEISNVNDDDTLEILLPGASAESIQPQEEIVKKPVDGNADKPIGADGTEVTETTSVEETETDHDDSDAIKPLQISVTELSKQIAGLSELFETKILHTTHEEKIVDQMHKELQRYKEDMYSQLVRPILLDIIEIRDSILRISSAHRSKPEGEQNIPLKTFEMYASDVQEILGKNNIEIFKSVANTDFVPIRHRATKKVATPDESLHGKLAESLSDGYTYMGKIITPEKIAVYSYEPQKMQTKTNIKEEAQNG
jgi:molecular chaperone GrpE (heat shock protein)